MVTQEMVKKAKIKFPVPGVVIVRLLKKNITQKCLVIRVGPKNSTVEIKGIEAKVENDLVDIDDEYLYPDVDE